jgi:hypothetical protein
MRGHRFCFVLAVGLSLSGLFLAPHPALAYVGPGPALELVPYFYSLLTWVGLALGAALLWPVQAWLRLPRRAAPRTQEVAEEPSPEAGRRGQLRTAAAPPGGVLPGA